jgi:hypothetical protein
MSIKIRKARCADCRYQRCFYYAYPERHYTVTSANRNWSPYNEREIERKLRVQMSAKIGTPFASRTGEAILCKPRNKLQP